jgi:hypothetical protein
MEFHFNVSNLFGGFIHFQAIDFFDNIHLKSGYHHSAEFESAAKREGSKGGSPSGCIRRFPLRLPNILCNVVRI